MDQMDAGCTHTVKHTRLEELTLELAQVPIADLLRTAYRLTHTMHGSPGDMRSRSMRDRIDTEIARRCGE